MLGGRSGSMRRCRGAGLAALAAVLLVVVARAEVQQEPSLETTEGSGININCSHPKIQTNEMIYWYRLLPGRGPELLVSAHKGLKDLPDILAQLRVSADRRWSALWLWRPRRGDAAVYYCALGARAEEPGLRPGTNRRGRGRAGPGAQRRPRPAGGAAAPPAGPCRARAGGELPTSAPVPQSAQTPEPTPEPATELTLAVEPEPTPASELEPTLEQTPEPTLELTLELTPESTPAPAPTPTLTPEPTPTLAPAPTPTFTLTPTPQPILSPGTSNDTIPDTGISTDRSSSFPPIKEGIVGVLGFFTCSSQRFSVETTNFFYTSQNPLSLPQETG
ncbi:cyclin-dependent kinase inhibitor 1C-like [Prinia subflava]|uniref:cyclin-dependent kinase inhibitor 1C-like n=1 Tax=Prinia subflava TaxID=208062 RepID=UPI002FDF5F2A